MAAAVSNDINDDEKKTNTNDQSDDLEALDKMLLAEDIGKNTSDLKWEEIQFVDDDERNGAKELANKLQSEHKLTDLHPFEMARYFIGSKCRVPKAAKKWADSMNIYKAHNLQSISEQQLIKCFREMSTCMRFGGVDNKGRAILVIKYSVWFPANYESADVIMKCFLLLLNYFTENLEVSRNGMVFIADCAGLGWVNFDVNLEKIFMKLLQEVYPLRVGAMYMLNPPFLLNILMTICKPFLSKKMKERMHVMSTTDLFKIVPKEQVPDLIEGGTYDDRTLNPMYQSCVRYARRCNIDHFAPVEAPE